MKLKIIFIGLICNVAIFLPTMIWAGEITQELSALSDEEVSQRLRFIEQRLDEGRRHANYWQIGWTGFYAISSTAQGTAAIMTDDGDNRANYIVGAILWIVEIDRVRSLASINLNRSVVLAIYQPAWIS